MGIRKTGQETVRNVTRNSSGTYSVSLPIEFARELHWQRGQKVVVNLKGNKLTIQDWKK